MTLWTLPMDARTAAALVLADTTEPCHEGHFDCAVVQGGDCSGEALAVIARLNPSARELEELADAAEEILR